jgi:hypothetical protein
MRYPTIKFQIYVKLHIGSKIRAIENEADTGIVDLGKLARAETIGSARRGSDIDLFGYPRL